MVLGTQFPFLDSFWARCQRTFYCSLTSRGNSIIFFCLLFFFVLGFLDRWHLVWHARFGSTGNGNIQM